MVGCVGRLMFGANLCFGPANFLTLLSFTEKMPHFFDMEFVGRRQGAENIWVGVAQGPEVGDELVPVGFVDEEAYGRTAGDTGVAVYDKFLVLMLFDEFDNFASLVPRESFPSQTMTLLVAGDVGENLTEDAGSVHLKLPKCFMLVADGNQAGVVGQPNNGFGVVIWYVDGC